MTPHDSRSKGAPRTPRNLAVLVSGSGRSLANLLSCIEAGELEASIQLVISDRDGIRALDIAREAGIATRICKPQRGPGDRQQRQAKFADEVFGACLEHDIHLVVLAGFLRLLPVPPAWRGRVINIHPSLLPKFGGRGFYGDRVHRAVLQAGEPTTGCTVHFVDDTYDTGAPILTREIAVHREDTSESLAARVFEEECLALPEAIRRVLAR